MMSFELGPDAQTGWGHLSLVSAGVEVPVIRLDTYCREEGIDWIDVLKIDVEGADTWVLEGAQRLLQEQRIGTVFFEEDSVHMHRLGVAPGAAAGLLLSASYRLQAVGPGEFMASCLPKRL